MGYLDHGHHAIMGYALCYTAHNFAIQPKDEVEEEQEQEVFFWNVKNHKITLIRVNARLSVVKQLKIGTLTLTLSLPHSHSLTLSTSLTLTLLNKVHYLRVLMIVFKIM